MGKSFRKVPKISGKRYNKDAKRRSSKSVRRFTNYIPDGNYYKKIYPSYDIVDYKPRCFDKTNIWYYLLKRK